MHDHMMKAILSTLSFLMISLLTPVRLWAEVAVSDGDSGGQLLRIIGGAGPIVKLVMFILLIMSVISWAVIYYKHREIKRWLKDSKRFYNLFLKVDGLNELIVKSSMAPNPLQNIFKKGIADVVRGQGKGQRQPSQESVAQRIARAGGEEMERIEQYVPFLATTGSTAPYIGLFGTVWGILAAFWEIGKAGTSSLAVVGPYIAEALIATALGLATAIPAVIFYNFFVNRIRRLGRDIDDFSDDLLVRIGEEYY